jgi:hypothetical protein
MPFPNDDQRNTQSRSARQKKSFTSAHGHRHRPVSDRQNTVSRESAQVLYLCLTIFVIGYLEKGARGVRGTLKKGEQEHSFGQYSAVWYGIICQ